MNMQQTQQTVIPAKAGIQLSYVAANAQSWIPARGSAALRLGWNDDRLDLEFI